ncbi:MAG TPA: transposase [Pirellulales bacterium]|jgi:putative transposase
MTLPHRKRLVHFDSPGDVHCLTFSCFHRLPLLSKPRSCQWFVDALALARQRGQFDLWAFVVMPEHVHIVMRPKQDVKVAQILSTVKQSVSKKALRYLAETSPDFLAMLEDVRPSGRRSYRFWQRGGGYDRNLRSLRDVYEKIEYVHNNPVRRGLATSPESWNWSSARAWATGENEPLEIDRDRLPSLMPLDLSQRFP